MRSLIARLGSACLCLLFGLAAPLLAQETPALGLYDRPVLVLYPGMHTAPIRRADVDAAGQLAVTGSEDKTVRVWSLADGKLLRTIRMPSGPGNVGKIFAVALSPDGGTIAAGGWTRWTEADPEEQIYLFDAGTGAMTGRLDGLPNGVLHLAFSPDGTRLAAVLGGSDGLRLYGQGEDGAWAEMARDTEYGDLSYDAAFSADSRRLATTGLDGSLRLYDREGRRLRAVETATPLPYGLAFNPKDDRLAVGFAGSPELRLHDGETLAKLPAPDISGIDPGNLLAVAWSADGATLYAGGTYGKDGNFPVVAWTGGGAGPRRELPAGLSTLMSLKPLADGRLLAAAADPWLGLFRADDSRAWTQAARQMDPRDQRHNLGLSPDGKVVDFGFEAGGARPARSDVAALDLVLDPPEDGATRPPRQAGLEIADWVNSYTPTLDGVPLPLWTYEMSRSLAIHPDASSFLLGTEWSLRAFDAKGAELWRREVPGAVWAVNISGNGRLAVAAYADGTLRWHRMTDGAELLALFPFSDDTNRWVLWTPEGYYAAAPGAADALGWVVNRGWDVAAEYYPITAFGGFFAPEALRLVPGAMETPRALGLAKIDRDRKYVQQVVDSPAPPGPQLHVLVMGVSRYTHHESLNLDFADDDATNLARALLRQDVGLYARVNMAPPLLDENATGSSILKALGDLERRMQPDQQDVAVILFSGHGTRVGEDYYLLPADVEAQDETGIEYTGVDMDRVLKLIGRMGEKGKVLVLLDACHSGAVQGGAKSATPPDIADVRADLAAAGNGVIVLSSSSGTEVSRESLDWQQGAFTKAVLEALAGAGDADGDDWLTVAELEDYVVDRVRELTGNAQTPVVTVPGGRHYQARLFRTF